MIKMLKSYVFWTYPRGSFHYDVMVTLILIFIFLSPLAVNYHDRPQETMTSTSAVLVKPSGANGFVFDLGADQVPDTKDEAALKRELLKRVQPITGAMVVDRYQEQKDARGEVIAYRVWAHRDQAGAASAK